MGLTAILEGLEEEKYLLLLMGKKAAERMNKRQRRHAKHFQDGAKQCCRQTERMNGLDAERRRQRHKN